MYIVFEGIDGSGKGTQIDLLEKQLKEYGRETVVVRTPGATQLGEQIRHILFHSVKTQNMAPYVADSLFLADWLQTSHYVVTPSLASGKDVLCDRSPYSQFAYGVERETAPELNIAFRRRFGPEPDLIFLLYGTPEHLLARARARTGSEGTKQDGKAWNKVDSMRRIQDKYVEVLGKLENVCLVPVDMLNPQHIFDSYILPRVGALMQFKETFKADLAA